MRGCLSEEKVKRVMKECLTDELLLVRPIKESATLYKVSIEQMTLIRKKARVILGVERKVHYLRLKRDEKRSYRTLNSLREADQKYPGVIQSIHEGANLSMLGRKFGLKRQRVHQFKVKVSEVQKERGDAFLVDFVYTELPSLR